MANKAWISVKKKPPKCGQIVLARIVWGVHVFTAFVYVIKHKGKRRYGLTTTGTCDKEMRRALGSYPVDRDVTHWMPIPSVDVG